MEHKNIAKPIRNREELAEAVKYIALNTSKMVKELVGRTFPIESLTVFAHSEEEFGFLSELLKDLGKPFNYNNGPRVELYKPIVAGENRITHLRIRKPDSERPQVGCNDFEVDYETFKNNYLLKYQNNLRLIKRPEYEMIEVHDRDFNVLAYVVSGQMNKMKNVK